MICSIGSKPEDTKMTMQADSIGGDMPQYDNSGGSPTKSKETNGQERFDDPKEWGYVPVCNS